MSRTKRREPTRVDALGATILVFNLSRSPTTMEDQELERAVAWLKVAAAKHPQAEVVLRIWSGFLRTEDAWKRRFPDYEFDPITETVKPKG